MKSWCFTIGLLGVFLSSVQSDEPTCEISSFRLVDGSLEDLPPIPFQREWLRLNRDSNDIPGFLYPPNFVRIYERRSDNRTSTFQLAAETQAIIDRELEQNGALLFRNLPLSAREFRQFWDAFTWPTFRRMDPFYDRYEMEGIHLAPRAYPENVIEIHNEQTYNPHPPNIVLFYALQPAPVGGETLLARNDELTDRIDPWIQNFVKQDGGVMYNLWRLYDRTATDNPDKHAKSWQHKTGLEDFEAAKQFLVDFGFNETDMMVDEEGTVHIRNLSPNFAKDGDRDLWLRSISFRDARRPNGEDFPFRAELEMAEWRSSYAFKLEKGDLLVLDNLRVTHGRLPYINGDQGSQERKILTTYA